MKDLRIKIVLSVLLILAGAALSEYSSLSEVTKDGIAKFITAAGVISLIITFVGANRGRK